MNRDEKLRYVESMVLASIELLAVASEMIGKDCATAENCCQIASAEALTGLHNLRRAMRVADERVYQAS